MRFNPGIIQGRLLPPVDGHIQEFPKDNWEKEFEYAKENNINHIEWLITKKSFSEGVLCLDIEKYSNQISSICCDNLIDKRIYSEEFLSEQLRPICDFAVRNNIKAVSIPLLEDSELLPYNQDYCIKLLSSYGAVYPELCFYFEMESPPETALVLVNSRNNFFYTYDTGNITSCGYNHEDYLQKLIHKTRNIHLKDRVINPIKTVEPGTGDTNFKLIFDFLKKNNYIYLYTIQTARGDNGKEVETIKRHIKFYEQFI